MAKLQVQSLGDHPCLAVACGWPAGRKRRAGVDQAGASSARAPNSKELDQPGSLQLLLPRPSNRADSCPRLSQRAQAIAAAPQSSMPRSRRSPAIADRGRGHNQPAARRLAGPPPTTTHNTSSPDDPRAHHAPGGNAWWPVPLASAGVWGARPVWPGPSTPGRPSLGRSRRRRGAWSGRSAWPGYDISVCIFCIRANHQACRHVLKEGADDANPASFARVQAR